MGIMKRKETSMIMDSNTTQGQKEELKGKSGEPTVKNFFTCGIELIAHTIALLTSVLATSTIISRAL